MSIPIPTVKRFPSYLRILNQAKESGRKYISATNLADELGLNPIQVRKDISSTGIEGKPKIGFDIDELTQYITHVLGWDNTSDALIVGAGNLGSAIARYDGFASYGLKIVAIFDKSTEKIGTTVGSFTVKSMESLNRFITENRISIAVITVPASQAQAVCDLLDGACNAVVQFFGIMRARLFTAGDLLPQAHIYAADELGLFAVVFLKMRTLFILGGGKIGLDLFRNFVVIKEIAFEEKAHQLV